MKTVLQTIFKKLSIKIMCIIILVGINVYLLTFPSKILGKIIDLMYNIDANKAIILRYIIYLLLASIGILIARIIWKYLIAISTRTLEKDLKDKLFSQFLSTSLTNIQNIKNGEIMSYFVKDVGEIRGILYRILSHASRIIFTFIIATYTMKQVNLKLTLAVICPIIVTLIVVIILKRYVERSFKKAQRYFTSLSEYVQESTDSIRTTKAYSGELNQLKKFIKKNSLLKKGNIAVDVYSTLLSTSVTICFGFCYGITILYGSKLVLAGEMTIGDFVAFNGYIDMFFSPIYWLPGVISKFERAMISYKRLDKVFSLEKENLLLENREKNLISGDIEIKNLDFSYPNNIEKVLKNINITIKQGSSLGIIGTIGSGKTTLMNLLLRLYDATDGAIKINGTNINDFDITQLRENICYITQDNFLFSTTIKENISLFRKNYDDKEIKFSTEKAMFSEELASMKDDIYTIIGERGIDLSGGQKQRVVISRAFLTNSNIIIFDDTFSALDNKTEEYILKNIKELAKDKTCIIISNRISDVKDTDHIIVLDQGEIVEQGKHNSLLKNNGLYKKFYKQQASNKSESILA